MKRNLIMLAVFLGLLGAFFATREDRVVSDELSVELPELDVDSVDRIEVGGSNAVELKKSGDAWLLADNDQNADADAVKRGLEALGELKIKDLVSQSTEKHATYEVDQEKGVALKVMSKGNVVLNVVLGKMGADFKSSYLRLAGEDAVLQVNKNLKTLFSKPKKSWQDLGLIKVERNDVTEIGVQKGAEQMLLTRTPGADGGAGGEFTIAAPPTLPEGFQFDSKKADRILGALASLRANESLNEAEEAGKAAAGPDGGVAAPSDDPFGFASPAAVTTLKTKEGKTFTVTVGGERGDNGERYVKVAHKPGLFTLSKWAAGNLTKGLDDLRDLTIANYTEAQLNKLSIQEGRKNLTFEKKGTAWTLSSQKGHKKPAGFVEDPEAIKRMAGALSFFTGDEWVEPQPDDKSGGFSPPSVVLKATTTEGADVVVEVGKYDAEKKGYNVRSAGGPVFFAREWRVKRFAEKSFKDFEKKAEGSN